MRANGQNLDDIYRKYGKYRRGLLSNYFHTKTEPITGNIPNTAEAYSAPNSRQKLSPGQSRPAQASPGQQPSPPRRAQLRPAQTSSGQPRSATASSGQAASQQPRGNPLLEAAHTHICYGMARTRPRRPSGIFRPCRRTHIKPSKRGAPRHQPFWESAHLA